MSKLGQMKLFFGITDSLPFLNESHFHQQKASMYWHCWLT